VELGFLCRPPDYADLEAGSRCRVMAASLAESA